MRYSIVIAEREGGPALGEIMPELRAVMRRLLLPYEIICVEHARAVQTSATDVSNPAVSDPAASDFSEFDPSDRERLRIFRYDAPCDASDAAGAAALSARGELVIVVDAALEPVRRIPHLIAGLAHSDLVVGRTRDESLGRQAFFRAASALTPLATLSRRLRGLTTPKTALSAGGLFWAIRRKTLAELAPRPGMFRRIERVAASRGYRATQLATGLPLERVWTDVLVDWLERLTVPSRRTRQGAAAIVRPADAAPPYEQRQAA